MPVYDPALYADQLSETPVEVEVVTTALKILRELRTTLAQLSIMQATWNNEDVIPEMIAAAATNNELLAGHSPADWVRWGTVFTELQIWLNTPIASIQATPQQVLMKRYTAVQP